MKTIGDLQLLPVWVNPNHLAATAKILLAGHRLRALGVIEGGALLGTIGYEELISAPDHEEVRRFVKPLGRTVSTAETCRAVGDSLASEDLDYIPVVQDGVFLGIVTATMLLGELGQSWDPLTGLSWSDSLRAWGIRHLMEGQEVTILFIDLDDFGLYNKKFGHIVGDKVLIKVASYLGGAMEDGTDILVRYGGDEFAIATIRSRRETEDLLRGLERGLQGTLIADSDQPVSFSAGIFGGRRSKERENIHYSATLDAMINQASREAQAAKEAKKNGGARREASPASAPKSVLVVEVFATGSGAAAMDTVILSSGEKVASGVYSRDSHSRVESVVQAAIKALQRLFENLQIEGLSVELSECESGERLVTVSGRVEGRPATCSLNVTDDLYRTAAQAAVELASGA